MEYDVVIVGGGPAGLSCAIRLKQLAAEKGREMSVCVLEKGSEIGAHILSGACIEPKALDELVPKWRETCPFKQPVTDDAMYWLTSTRSFPLPAIPSMHNEGNYVGALGALVAWLGEQAAELGVDVLPGTPAASPLYENDKVVGVITRDVGIGKDGSPTHNYQPGMEVRSKVCTVIAEGCRGSLTKVLERKYDLRRNCDVPVYAIGYKEVWEIPEEAGVVKAGTVLHTAGWPLTMDVYGGSFMYHVDNTHIHLGLVVGLGYRNPYLHPYMEFQRMKHHPFFKRFLTAKGAQCIAYGARTLNEGGITSTPQLSFPGGVLIGDTAGFLNIPKIKGTHTCMKSGMEAAESIFASEGRDLDERIRKSWAWKELWAVRNYKQLFGRYGAIPGFMYCGISEYLLKGREPWTFKHHGEDHDDTKKINSSWAKPIEYPKPDGVLSFDRLTNLIRSSVNHNEDQQSHLKLLDPQLPNRVTFPEYAGPEQRYCPAGVYEYVDGKLTISAQNCLHCKACDIKDPKQNITWTVPEGGGGPNYASAM